MNGLECLKAELLKRGYTKQQCDSKVVLGVLEIVSGSSGKYVDLAELDKDIQACRGEQTRLMRAIATENATLSQIRAEKNAILKELNDVADFRYNDALSYIGQFNTALLQCETPEARDQMKKAQMFVQSTSVDTKYDNTAFIIGLAAILSDNTNGQWALKELSKINTKLPRIGVKAEGGHYYGHKLRPYGIVDLEHDRIL